MEKFVFLILEMSIEAAIVLCAVLLLRLAFRKLPKRYSCVLWFLVLFRLLCPVTVTSSMSLMPELRAGSEVAFGSADSDEAQAGQAAGHDLLGMDSVGAGNAPAQAVGAAGQFGSAAEASGQTWKGRQGIHAYAGRFREHLAKWAQGAASALGSFWAICGVWLSLVWLAGAVWLTVVYAVQYMNWKETVRGCRWVALDASGSAVGRETATGGETAKDRESTASACAWHFRRSVRLVENSRIEEPYVSGILKPVIYLPAGMEEKERAYIFCHEQMHIRHQDPLVRLLWQAALILHWFNPLVWLAVSLVQKDMEMFCDESVMKQAGREECRDYAMMLLRFSVKKSGLPFPVAFGESNTESRIRHILKMKKPAVGACVLAVAAIIGVAAVLMTDPEISGGAGGIQDESIGSPAGGNDGQVADNGRIGSDNQTAGQQSREEMLFDTASRFAAAFCNRDGATIASLMDNVDDAQELEEVGFEKAGGSYTFGWSSPWPWFEDYDLNIAAQRDEAAVTYYARVSDPMVFAWKQTLQLTEKDGSYVVTGCETDMSPVASASGFREKYHWEDPKEYLYSGSGYRFKNTPMDLFAETADGQPNAELSAILLHSDQSVQQYLTPESSAARWLNLDGGEALEVKSPWEDKTCLRWQFADGLTDIIVLAHPEGDDGSVLGLWLVEDILEEAAYERELGEE